MLLVDSLHIVGLKRSYSTYCGCLYNCIRIVTIGERSAKVDSVAIDIKQSPW